jgi:hypothetical protein
MDIVIKSVLEYIQSLSGHTNTVLAGGAPRDILLGLTPKDYDLVIPSKNPKQIHELSYSVVREFKITDMVLKTQDYENQGRIQRKKGGLLGISKAETHASKLTCVYGFTFEGKKIDLIGHKEDDDEDFPNEVIQGFDYGINMVYDTGSYVYDENSFFQEDLTYRTMTLVNLPDMSELPKAMERYNRLSNRYKEAHGEGLRFRSTCLELNKPKTVVKNDPYGYKKLYGYADSTSDGSIGIIGPEPDWAATTEVNAVWDQPGQAATLGGQGFAPAPTAFEFNQAIINATPPPTWNDVPAFTVSTDDDIEFNDNF